MQQAVRYWGETDDERQAKFAADASVRAASGWSVVGKTNEYVFGQSGLDLVVTYEQTAQPPDGTIGSPPTVSNPPPVAAQVREVDAPFGDNGNYGQPKGDDSRYLTGWRLFFLGSGPAEPAVARYVRRTLVYFSLVAWLVLAVVGGSAETAQGKPVPARYPSMAVLSIIPAFMVAGLAWYLARGMRIPAVVRIVGVALLALLALAFIGAGYDYATGQIAG